MKDKLYDLMDWTEVEGIVYSEEDNPHSILGPHITEYGVLIQTFMPRAEKVSVKIVGKSKEFQMTMEDEEGFFAALLPGKSIPEYVYKVVDKDKTEKEVIDPYIFSPQISERDTKKFNNGENYKIYEKLGAHEMTINGVEGVYFAVWAPFALRVSVVGDFNNWDGRVHQMRRLWDSGIFEIFVPGIKSGEIYKYEVKRNNGLCVLKADPYANAEEMRPANASVVAQLEGYSWTDSEWLNTRKKTDTKTAPMSIYEVHLGSWKKPEDKEFYNYRELAPMLAEYVTKMGYTHIEVMPIMEHPLDASWGYQVTGYFAPTSRYGDCKDFMYFVDYMHKNNIGVILDWVPAHFPKDEFGLACFDGTCLYEHKDPRQGTHPHWGTLIYNYGRPEVRNFLIASAMFWLDKYHIDGIRVDAVASMLYLDYGKNHGEWVANMYGGNENLEAIEFLKQLNAAIKDRKDGTISIAEESTAWPKVTTSIEDGGLGFDYKWNMGWMNDVTGYMSYDPYFRSYHYGEAIFSMVYAYSEDFILPLSHDEVVHEKGTLVAKMPGEYKLQFANLRALYGYMMVHPGKKLLFMGQDIAQYTEWSEEKSVEWSMLQYEHHKQLQDYVRDLNMLYRSQPALYELDYNPEGFIWINNISANENIIVFTRNSKKKDETLLVVCNFVPVERKDYKIGVPFEGKYKEIFNSDAKKYGGNNGVNPRVKNSKKDECDDREDSLRITVPALGVSIFKYEGPLDNKTSKPKTNTKKVNAKKNSTVTKNKKNAKTTKSKAK